MKAILYNKERGKDTMLLSETPNNCFCVGIKGDYKDDIIIRPSSGCPTFAINITANSYWSEKPKDPQWFDIMVRILKAGELIEIV